MTSDAQEVKAEVIDVPEVISGADRWLAVQRAKVAGIAAEYVPHELTTGDDYRGYKEALDGWEGMVIESRTDSVQEWYEDTQGDVATLVPFATLWARFAEVGKWGLYGTNEITIQEGVAQAVTTVQGELDTINRAPYEDEDRKGLTAEYLRTLDLSAALRDAEDARQRRERIDRKSTRLNSSHI